MKFRRAVLLAALISILALSLGSVSLAASTAPLPVVAIHVSEVTQALETVTATPPTPTGVGNSGFEWWYTSWHYFVMHESLKEALRSDGTPYVVVTDADITAGALLNADGSPRYPIVISLTSEAIRNDEVGPLRSYVAAGGFLFVGSSAFTRNPNGTTRGDFALASEMGLHMVNPTLSNWYVNGSFNKLVDHRLVTHIPWGSLVWHMPLEADQIPWGTTAGHAIHTTQYAWQVLGSGAEVLANGGAGPLIATNGYGKGRFIYHGGMQPLLGHGSYDAGMYSYVIFRRAIEWAFESANVPIFKLSPWRYAYDAAFVVRHDFENFAGSILAIEGSAQFESSVGAKGDYFFCTGTLRVGSEDSQLSDDSKRAGIESLGRAVSLYGATIGSHNGGLANPVNPTMAPGSYDYWHWGPDEALDTAPAGYANGKAYALASIGTSYTDIEGWLTGLDNGRTGCGASGPCPRIWVSPYFNSTREDSYDIFRSLDVTALGEQKCGPFPHWTVSTRTPGMRYPQLTLPVSEWYLGSDIGQALDNHNTSSMRAAVDTYYSLGALVNIYMHNPSNGGLPSEYVTYNLGKPRMWATNAVGVYDWWAKRSTVTVAPSYNASGTVGIADATVTGATDPETAVEMVIPNWSSGAVADVQVFLNGAPVNPANYRLTDYGVKVRVGAAASAGLEVRYTPLQTWTQTNWTGGPGQAAWSDETRFESSTDIDATSAGQLSLPLSSGGSALFSDDFTRAPAPDPVPFTWTIPPQSTGNRALFNTTGGFLNSSTSTATFYGFAYPPDVTIGDGSVEADIRFQASAFGGGLMGRLNTVGGQRYGAWIYPDGSAGGSNVLKLLRFTNWTTWTGTPVQQVSLPSVGAGWHHMKMKFTGSRIQVYYDNPTTPVIDATDGNLTTGSAGVDYWTVNNTFGPTLNNFVVRDGSDAVVFNDDFGPDPTDQLAPWIAQIGSWSASGGVLQGSSGTSLYGFIYRDATWTDYTVEGRVQFPAGAFGGGIGGRLNAATGAHYGAWLYPDASSGGPNVLKLIKYRDWTSWSGTPVQQVSLASVGTGWHTLKLGFTGARIQVWYDGNQVIDVVDSGFDGRPAYASGGVSADMWTQTTPYTMSVDDVTVRPPSTYGSGGTLLSSAFDGGVGVQWRAIAWDAAAGGATGARVRTRTADRANLLSTAPWSAYYPASGSALSDTGRRWIQYELELTSADPASTPNFYELRVTYVPGIQLPGSNLTYTGPTSADSQSDVTLTARLLDDDGGPIAGRTVAFTLDGLGTDSVATDPTGQASTLRELSIPPGAHTLTVAFAGDASYAPVTIAVPFTVSSPWSAWIQDTQADFQADTPTDVDTTTAPGSVQLGQTLAGEGEEPGVFSVNGQPGWTYRRRLFVDNPNAAALRSGHSVELVLDTASLVAAGKLLASGDDLRVIFDDGTTWLELDRLAETPFDTASTEIWFKTQASIPASGREDRYFLYYGNPAAASPPANPRNVWALWDGFDGAAVDTTIWQPTGAVTVGGGLAHFAAGSNLFGRNTFADARFEVRLRLSAQNLGYSAWWGWEETPSDAPNIIVFEEVTTGLQGLMRRANGAFEWIDMPAPARTDWHTYAIRWWSGNVVWMVDGAPLATRSTNVPTIAQYPNLNAPGVAYDVDFVRARLDAAAEPIVSLASPQLRYAAEGRLLSIAYDTGRLSSWKYLTWDAVTPTRTAVALRVRSAATQAELSTAPWVSYAQSGLLVSNGDGRWVQYEATLTTTDSTVTPELKKVTLYYGAASCIPGGACSTGQSGVCAAGTEQCVAGALTCVPNVEPSPDACDGLDNDCNGTVDDGWGTISIDDGIVGIPGQTIPISAHLGNVTGLRVYSAELDVAFDSTVIAPTSVAQGAALTGKSCGLVPNLTIPGHVKAAIFCEQPLVGNASLVDLEFRVATLTYGRATPLDFTIAKLNEGCPAAVPDAGSFVVSGPEICDGQDNDGIGGIDDGLGQTTCGLGVCLHAIDNCVGGHTQTCDPTQGVGSETCNGLDDDCDGVVDDGGGALCNDFDACTADACSVGQCVNTAICSVGGKVYYYRDGSGAGSEPSTKGVPNVGVNADLDSDAEATTGGDGAYLVGGLRGTVTFTPLNKYGSPRASDHNNAITSLDASRVAMAAVRNWDLSDNQVLAGDVTGNHTLSSLDASYIARFSAQLVNHFPVAATTLSDWKFLLCTTNPLVCSEPPEYTLALTHDETAPDVYAILYGDVTGDWGPVAGLAASRAATSSDEGEARIRDRALTERFAREGQPLEVVRRAGTPAAELSLSGWKPLRAGERRQLTVDLRNADGILGLDLVLEYDPSGIAIVGVQPAGIGSALSVARGGHDGSLRIAAYGYAALSGSGSILTITVEGLKNSGAQRPPAIDGVANEGAIPLEVRGRGEAATRKH